MKILPDGVKDNFARKVSAATRVYHQEPNLINAYRFSSVPHLLKSAPLFFNTRASVTVFTIILGEFDKTGIPPPIQPLSSSPHWLVKSLVDSRRVRQSFELDSFTLSCLMSRREEWIRLI
jgi:hypothetical protein